MADSATNDEIIAFRLRAHHLDERLDRSALVQVAGAHGIQNSPPGSALTSLQARVEDLSASDFTSAIAEDKSLLQSWCMRGAPFVIPVSDLGVFTTGVEPTSEQAMRHFVLGVERSVDELGLELSELVDRTESEVRAVLQGRRLTITDLGDEVAERLGPSLTTTQREVWESEGPYAKGQSRAAAPLPALLRSIDAYRLRLMGRDPVYGGDTVVGSPRRGAHRDRLRSQDLDARRGCRSDAPGRDPARCPPSPTARSLHADA